MIPVDLYYDVIETDFGWIALLASAQGLWQSALPRLSAQDAINALDSVAVPAQSDSLSAVARQLQAYYAGQLTSFSVDLDMRRGTAFQHDVWRATQAIPYGQCMSYGELARRSGHPGAARAVGRAMALNPWPPIIPCHRVLRADGSLGGFGGGLPLKERMLALEGCHAKR